MYRKGKTSLLFGTAVTILLIAQLCVTCGAASTIPSKNEIVWETIGGWDYMDPHVNCEPHGDWIFHNVYETLYTYDWNSTDAEPYVPLLASSLSVSSDMLNYTFSLRQGITFHDGTPFNASCVKYNIERLLAIFDGWGPAWMIAEPILGGQAVEDAVWGYGEGSVEHITAFNSWLELNAVVVVDTHTVKIRLADPYAPFLAVLSSSVGCMISPTYIEEHRGVSIGEHNEWMDEHACGTGPFFLNEWAIEYHPHTLCREQERVVLLKNENYWRAAAALAQNPNAGSIDNVTIRINENVSSRILNLKTNETDGCYWPTTHCHEVWNGISGNSGDGTIKSSVHNLRVWCGEPTFTTGYLVFYMHSNISMAIPPPGDGEYIFYENPFAVKSFRKCVSYLFDYEAFIDIAVDGMGIRLQGPISHGMLGHKNDLFMFEYDLEKARDYWNEAMLHDNLDDILTNNSYTITLYTPSFKTRHAKACLHIKDGLEQLLEIDGLISPSQPLSVEVMVHPWINWSLQIPKQFPVSFSSQSSRISDPCDLIDARARSDSYLAEWIGLAGSEGWNAAEVDAWIESAKETLDPDERQSLYNQIQEAMVESTAFLWCYQETNFHVENAEMNGYVFNPMHGPYFYHYWKGEGVSPLANLLNLLTNPSFLVTTGSVVVIVVFSTLMCRERREGH